MNNQPEQSNEQAVLSELDNIMAHGAETLRAEAQDEHMKAMRLMAEHFSAQICEHHEEDGIHLISLQRAENTEAFRNGAQTVDGRKPSAEEINAYGMVATTARHSGRFPNIKAWISGLREAALGCAMYEAMRHPVGYLLIGNGVKMDGKRRNFTALILGDNIMAEFWLEGDDTRESKHWWIGQDDKNEFSRYYRELYGYDTENTMEALYFFGFEIRILHNRHPKVYQAYVEEMVDEIRMIAEHQIDDDEEDK